jgi:hypothetical protein
VREIRTLRSMSGEGKRDRAGNPRLSSTLLAEQGFAGGCSVSGCIGGEIWC